MKISKITIKQLFGIKEWQGDGKNIELVGDNGTGKTSVIDAIRYALTNSSDREFIVKNGETEGEIYIETDNGLSIDRKARTAMTDYKSVKQNGNVIPSPESFLKTIFTPLQLSPMEFISMDKKTQNATILDMIQYDWNLDTIKEWFGEIPRDVNYEQNILAVLNDIQAENGYYFMHRQDVNRDIRAKKAVIADIGSSLPIDYDGEHYMRYMDDFVIISDDLEQLKRWEKQIEIFLADVLKLQLNPKTTIVYAKNGVDFVGYRHWNSTKKIRKDAMRRLKRLMKNFKDGTITEEFFDKSFTSRIGSIKHADTYNLVQKITCEAKELKESHA